MRCLKSFLSDQRGMASVEYSLILAFVGLVIAIAMASLGVAVAGRIDDMATTVGE